jgi:hypothetical protein
MLFNELAKEKKFINSLECLNKTSDYSCQSMWLGRKKILTNYVDK